MDLGEIIGRARRVLRGITRDRYDRVMLEALEELRALFPDKRGSWYMRALIRVYAGVRNIKPGFWRVRGFPELGDRYSFYNVVQLRDGRYFCDCYSRAFGYTRRKTICTHVAAVILARKKNRVLEEFLSSELEKTDLS